MLKDILKSKGIKQKWLATKMGVSEVTLSNWVNYKSTPNDEHLKKLSSILDIPTDKLAKHYGK